MNKFKTVDCNGASKRIFEGSIRICSTDNKEIYKVRLELLNGKKNRNNWVYERIEDHLADFGGKPILYSVIDGKIANGHDFEIVRDKQTGEEYASFIGATSEHIGGYIEKETATGVLNPHIENINGVDWVVANGSLWRWYNKELVDEIEKNGGEMKVSIETLVYKTRIVNGVEYEEDYKILGVTILGTGIKEAVAGANIRKLSASMGELEKLKIRAASYMQIDNNEPQTQKNQNSKKGVTRTMAKVRKIDDLRSLFPNHTVLGVNGQSVALLNEKGRCCSYTFQENENTVVPERIEEIAVNSVFGEGENAIDVSAEELVGSVQAQLNSTKTALDDKTKECAELTAKINAMTEAERVRRRKAVETAIRMRVRQLKETSGCDIADNICDDMLTDEALNEYADMEDKNGAFCGDAKAIEKVSARCMDKVCEANIARKNSVKELFPFEKQLNGEEEETGIDRELNKLTNKYDK